TPAPFRKCGRDSTWPSDGPCQRPSRTTRVPWRSPSPPYKRFQDCSSNSRHRGLHLSGIWRNYLSWYPHPFYPLISRRCSWRLAGYDLFVPSALALPSVALPLASVARPLAPVALPLASVALPLAPVALPLPSVALPLLLSALLLTFVAVMSKKLTTLRTRSKCSLPPTQYF